MGKLLRATAAVAVGTMAIVAASTAAGADPKTPPVHLVCGGVHYEVSVAGNGQFTPGHDLGSTTVFVPIRFGAFHGTLTDVASGSIVRTESDTGELRKGNAQARGRTPVHCTYSFVEEFVATAADEGLVVGRLYRFSGSGTVTGFATGRR